jgi:hypothetical protein
MGKRTEKIPSVLWIPIIVGAVAIFIGAALALFYGLGYVEGFGSLLILVLGWFGFRIANNSDDLKASGLSIAVGITFFALMGMALDQTGNFIYNRPMEWIFCPEASELGRETVKGSARGGGITLSQAFACVSEDGSTVVRKISDFEHFSFRFVQYVVLGYILLYLSRAYGKIKRYRQRENVI